MSFANVKKGRHRLRSCPFPFEYRKGQKKLVTGVYHCIGEARNLFIQASTGVGKTISTIYPQSVPWDRVRQTKSFI